MTVVGYDVTQWLSESEALQSGGGVTQVGQIIWTDDGKAYVCVKLGSGGVTGDGPPVTWMVVSGWARM